MKTIAATLFFAVLSLIPISMKAAPNQTPTPASAGQCVPPAVVASFLNFSEAQTAQFTTLLSQFQPVLQGLQQQVAQHQAQLELELSQPNPNPADIVSLVLQIHALQQQIAQAITNYQSLFVSLLTENQKQQVQAVTQASQLQPAVGAFVALELAPAPTPLPCQNP